MRIVSDHTFYSCAAHDDLMAQWSEVRFEPGPLDLDLSKVTFVDPYGIVGLVLFLTHLPEEAKPVALRMADFPPPVGVPQRAVQSLSQNSPVDYLTLMGFWEEVGPSLDVPADRLPVRPAWTEDKSVLIDVTRLHSRDSVSVMLRKSGEILQNLGYAAVSRGHVMEVLSELSSNVLDHAQAEYGGLVTTQTYRGKGGTRYLVMSIGDMGVGVRRSLSGNVQLQDRLGSDAQALAVAVGQGNSRFSSGGRGGGLPRVLEIARRYNGVVAFRSGTGALAYTGQTDERRVFDTSPQPGTQLRITLPEGQLMLVT